VPDSEQDQQPHRLQARLVAVETLRVRRPLSQLRGTHLTLVVLPAALMATLVAATLPASADSVATARARASVLRTQLETLQARADKAVEQYDLAQGQLGQAVTTRLSLDAGLQAARQSGGAQQSVHSARVRALYMSGGMSSMYATILAAPTVSDALDRIHSVQHVMAGDQAGISAADTAARSLAAAEAKAQRAAAEQTRLSARTQALADQVQGLLAQQKALLAQADARVIALEQAQAEAAALASARAFAAQMAAAQAQSAASAAGPAVPFPTGVSAPSASIATMLAAAQAQLGKPYVWGAIGPDTFDCSGFTGYAFAAAGIPLPRTAAQQYLAGPHPSIGELQPGDLLFWASDLGNWQSIDHVGIYLGNGQMIVAPHSGDVVKVEAVYARGYFGATRVDPSISGQVPGPQYVGPTNPAG
jgi:cell wall-associated NlpC family hydrolase